MKAKSDIGDITEEMFYDKVIIKKGGDSTLRIDALTNNWDDPYRLAAHKTYVYLVGTSNGIKEDISPKEYTNLLVAEGCTPLLLLPFDAYFPLMGFFCNAVFRLIRKTCTSLYEDKYGRVAGLIGWMDIDEIPIQD